ncbi:MAG: hypothetical protein ACJAYU_001741 [Bradymonadia bacterium]|jgi:hypothetical protein
MRRSFEASACRNANSLGPDHLDVIGKHRSVSYFESSPLYSKLDPIYRRVTIQVIMSVVGRILDAGASGLKIDTSDLAHSLRHWRTLVEEVDVGIPSTGATIADAYRFWGAAFEGLVRYPVGRSNGEAFSCGMHLLAAPDVILDVADVDPGSTPDRVMSVLCRKFLTEGGPESVRDGYTFRVDEDGLRWRAVRWKCDGYEEDEFGFNPYGRFRLSPAI